MKRPMWKKRRMHTKKLVASEKIHWCCCCWVVVVMVAVLVMYRAIVAVHCSWWFIQLIAMLYCQSLPHWGGDEKYRPRARVNGTQKEVGKKTGKILKAEIIICVAWEFQPAVLCSVLHTFIYIWPGNSRNEEKRRGQNDDSKNNGEINRKHKIGKSSR